MADPSFFELNNIDSFVQEEFKRRSNDIGFNYQKDVTDPYPNNYKGPRTAWIRVCSNTVDPESGLFGFIMNGVNGFDNTYGFNNVTRKGPLTISGITSYHEFSKGPATVLGYDVFGNPHSIAESLFVHRPSPGVTGLEVELMARAGKFRKTTIKWQCWSPEHLAYLENYFLIPTVSIFVEWGWNNFDPTSLLNLNDVAGLKEFITKESWIKRNIEKSRGNWDMAYGIITDFSYDLREDGGYDVSTTISNPSQLYSGFSAKDYEVTQGQQNSLKITPTEYIDRVFSNLPNIVDNNWRNIVNPSYGPENRIFYHPTKKPAPPNNFEVFGVDKKEFWVSFDLIVDMLNYFYEKTDSVNKIKHCTIDISDSVICAHKNLKSTNRSVLLIPNSQAPSGRPLILNDKNNPDSNLKNVRGTPKDPLNALLYKKRLEVSRVDLTEIICRSRKGSVSDFSFPNYNLNVNGNSGYLKHLYVNAEIVKNAVSKNEFIKSALKQILDEISTAACGIWDFDIVPKDINAVTSTMTVKDKNYIGDKSVKELCKSSYSFSLITSNSFIKNVKFNVKPSSNVTMQALSSGNTKTSPKTWMEFRNLDRIQGELEPTENMESSVSSDFNKASLRKINGSEFAIVRKDSGEDIRLCEPDVALQKSILDDKDPKNNAVYNAIMPNTTLDITIRGIAGLRFLDCFTVSSGLLPTYSKDNVLFQVMNVRHSLNNGDWYTTINAGVRPKPSFDK